MRWSHTLNLECCLVSPNEIIAAYAAWRSDFSVCPFIAEEELSFEGGGCQCREIAGPDQGTSSSAAEARTIDRGSLCPSIIDLIPMCDTF